jgi:quinoprotein glucose dehydrogenase
MDMRTHNGTGRCSRSEDLTRIFLIWLAMTIVLASVTELHAAESYGGPGGRQFSALTQITRSNVSQLEVAWIARTGDLNQGFTRKRHSHQTHPVVWNDFMFVSTSANWVLALDARSGEHRWRFDPQLPKDIGYSESASRGVSLWHGESETCPHRVFIGTLIGELYALNAQNGRRCSDFGDNGRIDLSVGVGEVSQGDYGITSPPAVLGDRLIVGSAIGDNRAAELERGIVRAIDARSGAVLWSWDPIPVSPQQPNYASWENDSGPRTGAANAWPPISVDTERNLAFVPTGSPSPDFYGGERLGDNHYANSLVALDGDSGAVVWHQQLVHHDVWDYDIPSQPTLTRLETKDGPKDAVLVVTKTGMLYAFERSTGQPLYAIEERPVPSSDVPGERLSPTQPYSSFPALANQDPVTDDMLFGISFWDRGRCRKQLQEFRSEGLFTPPSQRGTVMNPGYGGGANWGGIAVDESQQLAVTKVIQVPALVRLIPRNELDALRETAELDDWDLSRQTGTPYVMARRSFLSPLEIPCTAPPWNKLLALDLENQRILWEVPLGTTRDLAPAIVPNFNWGAPGLGGPLLTASGLIVIGASAEHRLRVMDIETGAELWHHDLPTAAMATPTSYAVDNIQYLAVAVGGHDNVDMPRGDYIYAFRLKTAN